MTSVRALELSPEPCRPSHTPPLLMLGNLTPWGIGNVPSDRWERGWAGQGPRKSKKYIYWGQCSQLGRRSSCLHWPKANKSGVKKDAISKHDWIRYIIPVLWVMMEAAHWQRSITRHRVRERGSGSAWTPIRVNPAQQRNKVNTASSCKRGAQRLAQASLQNPANTFWMSLVSILRWGGWPYGGISSFCRSILFDFPRYPPPREKMPPGWPASSWNLGNDFRFVWGWGVGVCLVWFYHYHNAVERSAFPGNRVGWRICHLSWHLKDKNGIINSASSSGKKKKKSPAGMSKWRTLTCSFRTQPPAAEVSLLIAPCHLS